MLIETQRLIIRNLKTADAISFVEMASDGSLHDIGFDKNCNNWMAEWIIEAEKFAIRNNPRMDYLAYTIALKDKNIAIGSVGCSYYEEFQETGITYFIGAQYRNNGYAVEAVKAYVKYFFEHYNIDKIIATIKATNISSQKVIEKAGFVLTEKKMYKDLNDTKKEIYHFYEIRNLLIQNIYK